MKAKQREEMERIAKTHKINMIYQVWSAVGWFGTIFIIAVIINFAFRITPLNWPKVGLISLTIIVATGLWWWATGRVFIKQLRKIGVRDEEVV